MTTEPLVNNLAASRYRPRGGHRLVRVFLLLTLFSACRSTEGPRDHREALGACRDEKISFDLAELSPEGLIGPADGRRAVDYEFCIPQGEEYRQEVQRLAPGIRFMPGSSGRSGCSQDEVLCVGSTVGPGSRETLCALSQLDYVERIRPCLWE